ncbi:MAG: c-type cytochrome, partial [Halobacteriales archaeon]|nr:c-type cytochrome [Halobacteriales archaeon]
MAYRLLTGEDVITDTVSDMKEILLSLLLILLVGCEGTIGYDDPDALLGADGSVDSANSSGASTSALTGGELYTQNCAGCHGPEAEGTAVWEGSIRGYTPIEGIVTQGRGDMPKIPLADGEIAKIQEYILSLAAPAAELDGEGLYQRYCSSCHGPDATGAETWPGSIQGYDPIAPIVEQGRGDMAAIDITAEQTRQIQEWLLTLAPSLDSLSGPEVYDRLCSTCHGKQGEGTATKGIQLRYDDDGYSEYWTRNGRQTTTYEGDMPAYPREMISDEQLTEIFEFIDQAPRPTDGEGLFVQYCSNCHGTDGRGGPSGKSVVGEVSP